MAGEWLLTLSTRSFATNYGQSCWVCEPRKHANDRTSGASESVRSFLDQNAVGVTMKNLNQGIISSIRIPVPSLQTQREIVAELQAERVLVEANRDLIARMEMKMDASIARVWAAAPSSPSK